MVFKDTISVIRFFYVSYRIFSSMKHKIAGVVGFTVLYIGFAKLCGLELFWYNSCLFFSLGLILAEYQLEIFPLLRRNLVFTVNSAIFVFLYLVLYFLGRLGIEWLFDMVYMFFFCGITLWLVQKMKDSWVLRILGYYSIEVYLIHTVIGGYFDATKPLSYILLPLISVVIGIPVHQISKWITDFLLRKKIQVN